MSDTSAKVYTPLPIPSPPATSTRPPPLTEEQEAKYQEVLKQFSGEDYQVPGEGDKNHLTDIEKCWVSRECILRYLRASKWDVRTASHRLEQTLQWRRHYGVYDKLTAEYVEPEALTGKMVLFGFDADRRPGLYMFPSRQNTDEPTRQIQFVVWMLERTIDLTGPGVENMALFINFNDRAKGPNFQQQRNFLDILQNHYPERLGRAYLKNIPFLINAALKLIMPFVDPVTREKIKFNPDVIKDGFVLPEQLMTASGWGGSQDFEYIHEKYWPALVELCETERKARMDRWRALGGKVGLSEWDIKGGLSSTEPSAGKSNSEKVQQPGENPAGTDGNTSSQHPKLE